MFILNALVVVIAIVMSLRDERIKPGQSKTSYFRYAETATAQDRDGGRGTRSDRRQRGGGGRSVRARSIDPA